MSYAWRPSGIHGAGFQNVVAVDPTGNGVVLSGADVAGVHRSEDWGDNWVTCNVGLETTTHLKVATILFSPTNHDVVVSGHGHKGAGGGLFVSTDNGQTWAHRSTDVQFAGGNNADVPSLPATHPRSTGNLLDIDATNGFLYAGTFDDGVMRAPFNASDGTGGTSWTVLGLAGQHIRSICRTDADTLYVATYGARVYRIDGIRSGSPSVNAIGSSPTKPEELVVVGTNLWCVSSSTAGDGGIWRMPLGTGVWQQVNDANVKVAAKWCSIGGYVNSGDSKHHLWAGCVTPDTAGDGTYRVSIVRCLDAAAAVPAWTPVTNNGTYVHTTMGGPSGDQWWLAADEPWMLMGRGSYVPAQIVPASGRLFVAGRSGQWRTTNPTAANPDWYPIPKGLQVTICRDVLVDPANSDRIYVGNTDWVFFTSSDGMVTVEKNDPNPNTGFGLAALEATGQVYLGSGDRDANVLGRIYHQAAPATGTWIDDKLEGSTVITGDDNFNRTTSNGDLGVVSSGVKTWTNPVTISPPGAIPLANIYCNGTEARFGLPASNGTCVARLGTQNAGTPSHNLEMADPNVSAKLWWDVDAVGAFHSVGILARPQWHNGVNSYYEAQLRQAASGGKAITLQLWRSDGGTLNLLDSVNVTALGVTGRSGDVFRIRLQVYTLDANTVRVQARVWDDGTTEPATWGASADDTHGNRITAAGGTGIRVAAANSYTAAATMYVDDLQWDDSGTVTAPGARGARPFGLAAGLVSGTPVIVAAVENTGAADGGVWRRVGSADWANVQGTLIDGQSTKAAPLSWPTQSGANQLIFLYDRANGVWRSADSGATWVRIWPQTSNAEMTGYVVYDLVRNRLWISRSGSLYRLDGAASVPEDAASPTLITVGEVTNIGPIDVDQATGVVYVARKAAASLTPALLVSLDAGATWVDVADDTYRGQAVQPYALSVGTQDGALALGLNGNGVIIGAFTPDLAGTFSEGEIEVEVSGHGDVIVTDPGADVTVQGSSRSVVVSDSAAPVVIESDSDVTVEVRGNITIEVLIGGGSSGGVSDHGALTGLADDDHPQYFLADGSRELDGDLVVAGVVPTYWHIPNSPRHYAGVDYYTPGVVSCALMLRNADGLWVPPFFFVDDGVISTPAYQWTSGWSEHLQIHLCDGTGLGVGKFTVVSNRPWSEVDAEFAVLFGPGLITADSPNRTGWSYTGAPTYAWTDGTALAVCAPSAATAWPDPATMVPFTEPALTVDREGGNTVFLGNVYLAYGGTLDLTNGANFRPPTVSSGTEPTPTDGQLVVWEDSTLGQTWLIVGTNSGNRKVELI